jgi:hypothetical protein
MRLLQNSPRRRLERRALLGKSWKSRLFAPSNARRSGFAEVSDFQEFPDSEDLSDFDAEDRKFVAVANAHPDKPPILQSTDTKWLNWEQPLSDCGIQLEILCRDELILIRQRKAKRK